ncbi:MAG TPA: hypothetical protein VLR46_13750 [Candidatus Dormibacteraeota bacterium]|nr:hypothetical protein [Candidatus Dormibacteraeota bacterium]
MSAVTGQVGRQVKAGRRVVDRTFQIVEKQVGPAMSNRRARVATGVLVASAALVAIALVADRRRRRRTLVARIQRMIPAEMRRAPVVKRALG